MTKETFDSADYWDTNDGAERLIHSCPEEAIEDWINDTDSIDSVPESVTVYGWIRTVVTDKAKSHFKTSILDYMHELLYDDYGPVDDYPQNTDVMIEAERVFIETFFKEYVPWRCDQIRGSIEVKIIRKGDDFEFEYPEFTLALTDH